MPLIIIIIVHILTIIHTHIKHIIHLYMYVNMHTCAYACMHTHIQTHVRESALKVDPERKIYFRIRESNLHQWRDGLMH